MRSDIKGIRPSKIICVGTNYADHAKELDMKIPEEPLIFMKPPSSIIYDGEEIVYPRGVARLDYEAELAVVVKKKGHNIKEADALNYILGYACLNDVTARDLQSKDGQWARSKSFDTFCPIGPHIESDIDPAGVRVESYLNGKLKQSCCTTDLIFPVGRLVSFVSGIMTLLPGDIISTGTPYGVGPMFPGDEIEIRIEGIGSLKNRVVGEK
jgi:2-keto-4-pentenoate hydratase/2-oxohepta-3-ene-1,7-dioic acid hydratase in catechol pathway